MRIETWAPCQSHKKHPIITWHSIHKLLRVCMRQTTSKEYCDYWCDGNLFQWAPWKSRPCWAGPPRCHATSSQLPATTASTWCFGSKRPLGNLSTGRQPAQLAHIVRARPFRLAHKRLMPRRHGSSHFWFRVRKFTVLFPWGRSSGSPPQALFLSRVRTHNNTHTAATLHRQPTRHLRPWLFSRLIPFSAFFLRGSNFQARRRSAPPHCTHSYMCV